jgi:preprotein translocase subunit YajC
MIIEAASKGGSSGSFFFLIIILAFVLLWLVVVRPQRKRQNASRQMLADLRVGDDILTAGGVYGTVTRIDEDEVRLEVAPNVEIRVARRAVAAILTEHAEPQTVEADETEDAQDDDERWSSAFDDEGSDEQKPG